MCADFSYVVIGASSGYCFHIDLDAIEAYLIFRAVALTHIYSISLSIPARVAAVACMWASRLPCCDPVRGAFFGGGGLQLQHLGPQCPILLHFEHLESLVGQSVLPVG